MKILYQAKDGQMFKTERECMEYEMRSNSIVLWDDDGKGIEIFDSDGLENAMFISCTSLEDAKLLKQYSKEFGWSTPYSFIDFDNDTIPLGNFVWYIDQWYELNDFIAKIAELNERMNNCKTFLFEE